MDLQELIAANLFFVDSRLYGKSPHSSFVVDSRFRGNDGNRQRERAYSLDVPFATAGRSAAVARLRGNDGGDHGRRFRSFPAD